MEAQSWLNHFTPQARREMVSSQEEIPDVLDLTTSQLRQQLIELQQQRAERAVAHAAFYRGQWQEVEVNRQYRQFQRLALIAGERRAATFNPPRSVLPSRRREIRRYPGPRFWFISRGGFVRGLP
jgi:hypothetical protein